MYSRLKNLLALILMVSVLVSAGFVGSLRAQSSVTEGFEGFTSSPITSYTGGTITCTTGSWTFTDALIGNLSTDRRTGSYSARVRNTGRLRMNFDRAGVGNVTIQHAIFGTDGSSTWELWYSTNAGSTWLKFGSTVTTSSTSLQTATFAVNTSSTVRFEIRKVGGGTNRVNFDNITFGAATAPPPPPPPSGSVHLTMGNPSGATTSTSNPYNYLMEKPQYAMSYHRDRGIPNWVSWHVDPTWLGSTPRQDDFRADTTLPSGWYQVGSTSYSGSGFDRGHNCPSADRTSSVANNSATFLMTNMCPQAPDNNQGPWANLENYTRTLVNQGNEVYVICGMNGTGGTGSNGFATTINGGRVTVPAYTWKVIVVIPQGTNDLSRVTTSTRVIAVNMPNTQGIRSVNWGTYRVSVDSIESQTGYDILSNVAASIQSVIEARVDNGPTS